MFFLLSLVLASFADVSLLADDSYVLRTAAQTRLSLRGLPAVPALLLHRDHADLEVRLRVRRLLVPHLHDYSWVELRLLGAWIFYGPDETDLSGCRRRCLGSRSSAWLTGLTLDRQRDIIAVARWYGLLGADEPTIMDLRHPQPADIVGVVNVLRARACGYTDYP